MAFSDSTFPVCNERYVTDGSGPIAGPANVTSGSDSVQNTESSASASVHYDAIGLPLFTENVAHREAVSCQNSDLSAENVSAESIDNHVVEHGLDMDIMSSANTPQDNAVLPDGFTSTSNVSSEQSASLSASDIHIAYEDGKELNSRHGSDKNVACEESCGVETPNASNENIATSIGSLNVRNLECTTGSGVEPSRENTGMINLDVNDARAATPVDDFNDISVTSSHDVITSQAVSDVRTEEMVVADDDSCAVRLSPMMTEDTDEVDDGMDEVDKTVPSLYRMLSPATSMNGNSEVDSPSHDRDHLFDDGKKPLDLDGSESSWLEKEFEVTCGIDHVERVNSDGISRSRVKVKIVMPPEVYGVDKDFSPIEGRSESDFVINAHETVEASEVSACTTESIVCEIGSYNKSAIASTVPMQSDVQLSLEADHPPVPAPCSASAADTAAGDAVEFSLSQQEAIPLDITDRMYDFPAADNQSHVDSYESLQKCVKEETPVSQSVEVMDVVRPSSVTDAGDAENARLHQKPSKQSDDDSLTGVSADSIAMHTEPSAENETMLAEEFPEVQLSVEKIDLEAPSCTVKPDTQEVDMSMVGEKPEEQENCGLNNTVMLGASHGEPAEQLNGIVSPGSSQVAHVVDISLFNVNTSSNTDTGVDNVEVGKSVFYTHVENQTDDTQAQEQQQWQLDEAVEKGFEDTGNNVNADVDDTEIGKSVFYTRTGNQADDTWPQDQRRQSDEAAEKWFEEQFAACEDFDVDEFVSSAWSTFHSDSEPAVGNIRDEMLEQTLTDADDYAPVQLDTADAWQYVENAAVAGNAVDDSYQPSSSEYLENELEATTYPSSSPSVVTQPMPSVQGYYLFTN